MTTVIDGKKCANKLLEIIKEKTEKLSAKPGLAVILANNDESSKIYVSSKEKHSLYVGFKS